MEAKSDRSHGISGMGSLIDDDMVLTCAHILYFKVDSQGKRVKATDVFVNLGEGRRVKVWKFAYP